MNAHLDRQAAEEILNDVAQRSDEWFGLINGFNPFLDKLEKCIVSDDDPRTAQIKALHVRRHEPGVGPDWCDACSFMANDWVKWPCPTGAILDEADQ